MDNSKKRSKTSASVLPLTTVKNSKKKSPIKIEEVLLETAKPKKKRNISVEKSLSLGWTTARKRAVTHHLLKLQPMLRLQDWTIKVIWDDQNDESDDCYATNTPQGDSHHCEVRFAKKFLELDNKEMTQVIIHELMHCHLFIIEDYTSDVVNEVAAVKTAKVFNIGFTKLIETSIDSIADAFAELLPEFDDPEQ